MKQDMRKIMNLLENAERRVEDSLLEEIAESAVSNDQQEVILEYIESKLTGRSKRL